MRYLIALLLCFASCSSNDNQLRIAATSVPHADILQVVKEELKTEGIELKIVEIDDYNLPNRMLAEKQVDANFFQHKPFLDEQIKLYNYDIVPLANVHIEPLGIYSETLTSLDELKEGALVAIPQDPTNEARALMLLQDVGLIKLKETDNPYLRTPLDIIDNPKNLRFQELDAAYLPRALSDVTIAIIPVNFALQAGLDPIENALALESSDSPYVNIVVVRREDLDKETIHKLKNILESERLRAHVENTYGGVVIYFNES